jgi:hypothetical protein
MAQQVLPSGRAIASPGVIHELRRPASMPALSSACRTTTSTVDTLASPDEVSRRLSDHHSNPPRDAYLPQPTQCHVQHTWCTPGTYPLMW